MNGSRISRHDSFGIGLCFLLLTLLTISSARSVRATLQDNQHSSDPLTRPTLTLPPLEAESNFLFISTDRAALLTATLTDAFEAESNFLFISTDRAALLTATLTDAFALDPSIAPTTLMSWDESTPPSLSEGDADVDEFGHDGRVLVGPLTLSPDGRKIAIQVYNGPMPVVWILDLHSSPHPTLTRLTSEGFGIFLGWHPDSQHVLCRMNDLDIPDPGLWLVAVQDGSHQRLAIPGLVAPEGLLAAEFSPDGKTLGYALSEGMGLGSEMWLADSDGSHARRIRQDAHAVVSSVRWAPDGQQIAFTTLLDSPVPFTAAGLWVMERDGNNQRFLATLDGGHGQTPLWSHDGQHLYFVARENLADTQADYETGALVSSIRSVAVATGEERIVVPADGARQIDLTLAPDGRLLFASNRNANLELWSVIPGGAPTQLTFDGEAKRHPLVVP